VSSRHDTEDYRSLLLSGAPLMDTRAPVEFSRGAFPGTINLPLMDDEERRQVGICYKESGQQAAIDLGNTLVSGPLKSQRLENWSQFVRDNPDGYLYCFRGGLRSQTVQIWLRELGLSYPLIRGGYKAMRRFLLEELPRSLEHLTLVLIAGKTGTGKTRVINALDAAVDLEGLAGHRGSSFGGLLVEQPSQIDFENSLSIALMQKREAGCTSLLLEDEGHLIGRVALPEELRLTMQASSMLLVEESIASRVDVVLEDYVLDLGRRFAEVHAEGGSSHHEEHLRQGLSRIKKRLGGVLYEEVDGEIQAAFALQKAAGDVTAHRQWITTLLQQYYDPMYEYQLSRREGQITGRGSRAEVIEQAMDLSGATCN
jgi:tRNA 2-selenouridine synthase